MKRKVASVRPSPVASIIGIIIWILFLFFGLFFMDVPDEPIAIAFKFIWVAFCIGGIIYGIINLSTYSKSEKRTIPISASVVVEIEDVESDDKDDFEARLRKLESLRKDGLITEAEYRQKREEIMRDKW